MRVGVKKDLTFSPKAFNNLPKKRQIFGLSAPSLPISRIGQGAGSMGMIQLIKLQGELRLFWQLQCGNSQAMLQGQDTSLFHRKMRYSPSPQSSL